MVVGVDGSELSKRALLRAVDEARMRDAMVHAVHVFPPPQPGLLERDRLPFSLTGLPYIEEPGGRSGTRDEVIERAKRVAHDSLRTFIDDTLADVPHEQPRLVVIADRHPAEALIDHADGADLLVIGTRGLGGFQAMLLGSVAQQCVQHARCAVLVLPPNM